MRFWKLTEVSEKIGGVSPVTLREWARLGLISASRTPKGRGIWVLSDEQLQQLRDKISGTPNQH